MCHVSGVMDHGIGSWPSRNPDQALQKSVVPTNLKPYQLEATLKPF